MRHRGLYTLTTVALFALFSPGGLCAAAPRPQVAVSIPPTAYLAERIAGGRFSVLTLVGPGQNPHAYEPSPRQIADLSISAAWFTIGIEFEKALMHKVAAAYPRLKLIDVTEGIARRPLEAHDHDDEGHSDDEAPSGGHVEGGGLDPHVWLGRDEALAMAARMRDAFVMLDPAGRAVYTANYTALEREVNAVFARLSRELAPLKGRPVFVYHPAFGYFLDEFGIRQVSVETGGKEPTQRTLAALVARAKAEGVSVIFVQAQFPTAAATTLARSLGGVVLPLDDLSGDWLANLERMGEALKKGIR